MIAQIKKIGCCVFCSQLFIFQLAFNGFGASDSIKSAQPIKLAESESTYNPALAAAASMLIPGGGQFYTKKYLKAGTFFAIEAVTASVFFFWNSESQLRLNRTALYADSAESKLKQAMQLDPERSTLTDSTSLSSNNVWLNYSEYSILRNLSHHGQLEASYLTFDMLSWMIGGYLFNIYDAIGSTGRFGSSGPKNPVLAGWLSAVPALGLGQLYNGSISKAGMITMAQVSLGLMSYNYHRLMRNAENQYRYMNDQGNLEYKLRNKYNDDWTYKRQSAFRMRNTYLWYSVFFYLYGILDAVVDAHLGDYNNQMDISPDLEVKSDEVSVKFKLNY